ncbi:MAG: hypothetical protein QOJ17_2679 [Rhodospirillaceae bacterium]|jgi:hypothetical protein|nr:hypothetical protein [Rhodospirillaceae bacterium]
MAPEFGAAQVARGPAKAIGEIGGESVEVLHDAGEGPVGKRDVMWTRRRRELCHHDVDAGSLVLAVPFGGQAAREAEAARSGMRRHDPDDAAPCPGAAACEKVLGLIEEGRHGRGQDRVVAACRQVGRLPAGGDHVRRVAEAAETRAHGRGGFDGGPGNRRIAERRAELPAAGADIEQPADFRHGATDQRRQCRDIVRRVDGRGIELERIDAPSSGRNVKRN